MTRAVPCLSAMAPAKGWAMPQTRFWIAIAMPHASRLRARVAVIGSVKRPKLVRMPLVTAAMRQPAITRTISGTAAERGGAAVSGGHGVRLYAHRGRSKRHVVMGLIRGTHEALTLAANGLPPSHGPPHRLLHCQIRRNLPALMGALLLGTIPHARHFDDEADRLTTWTNWSRRVFTLPSPCSPDSSPII